MTTLLARCSWRRGRELEHKWVTTGGASCYPCAGGCPSLCRGLRMLSKSHPARYLPIQFLAVVVAACGYAADPEEAEPPLQFTLEVNGKQTAVTEDKPVRLAGEFKNPE